MSAKVSSVEVAELKDLVKDIETHIKNIQLTDRKSSLSPDIQKSWNDILGIIKEILTKLRDIVNNLLVIHIATTQGSDLYDTTISAAGDITNKFPSQINDIIWTRHNSLVDAALEERRKILVKIIEILGTIIKLPIP